MTNEIKLPNAEQIDRIINLMGGDEDIYGVEWDREIDEVSRVRGAKDLERSDFDTIFPWAGMRRCTVEDDSQVTSYYGDPNFTEDGSIGQVMAEIPKFYYKSYRTSTGYGFLVSPNQKEGFSVHPAFKVGGDEVEYIYCGAYEATFYDDSEGVYKGEDGAGDIDYDNDKLASIIDLQPISGDNTSLHIENTRKLANNRGDGWEQWNVNTVFALQLLALIEYATLDLQSVIGEGICDLDSGDDNHAQNTGHTSELGNESGEVEISPLENDASGADETYAMSYRGIENFYGNIWTWVDGLNIEGDHMPYINFDNENFESDKFTSPYEYLEVTLPNENNYGSDIVHNSILDGFGLLTGKVEGSSSTYLHSYYRQTTGDRGTRFGGYWTASSGRVGVAYWDLISSYSSSVRSTGGRLHFVKK